MEERDDADTERSELKTNAHTYAHTERRQMMPKNLKIMKLNILEN